MKKCWCQQNSEGVSRDSYIVWIFSRWGITVPSFIMVGYVSQILGKRGLFAPPPTHPWAAPKMPILNRFISTPPCRPRSQSKIKTIELAYICDTSSFHAVRHSYDSMQDYYKPYFNLLKNFGKTTQSAKNT